MNQHNHDIISITVMPDIRMLPVIQLITQEIGDQLGLEKEKLLKTTLAVEEVFGYCLKMVRKEKDPSRITMTYRRQDASLHIITEHQGPQGVLERHFLPGREESFPLTSFEAIGLKIAHDILDDLRYVRLYDGRSRYTATIKLPPEFPS